VCMFFCALLLHLLHVVLKTVKEATVAPLLETFCP
jgi:hypothetical protein